MEQQAQDQFAFEQHTARFLLLSFQPTDDVDRLKFDKKTRVTRRATNFNEVKHIRATDAHR